MIVIALFLYAAKVQSGVHLIPEHCQYSSGSTDTKHLNHRRSLPLLLLTDSPHQLRQYTAPTAIFTPTAIPESHYLEIEAHTASTFTWVVKQPQQWTWRDYYDILIYQYNFQHELPLSDNPDLGFVGDANGPWGQVPPYAYGVHAAPVADLLQKYGLDVEGGKGYTLEQMKEKLAAGHPVIVWVIGNMEGGVPAEYTDSQETRPSWLLLNMWSF